MFLVSYVFNEGSALGCFIPNVETYAFETKHEAEKFFVQKLEEVIYPNEITDYELNKAVENGELVHEYYDDFGDEHCIRLLIHEPSVQVNYKFK